MPVKSISVIIPVYGNGQHLRRIAEQIEQVFPSHDHRVELIAIDDCGPGDAWSVIETLVRDRPQTVGIQLTRNYGQHNATMSGFAHATGDVVITMDDDLQHDPGSIPVLLDALESTNSDVVYGIFDSKKHSAGRNMGSMIVNMFFRQTFRLPITVTSFRAIRLEVVRAILRYDLNFTFIDGLLAWNTRRIKTVTVPHHPRIEGRSGYSIGKLMSLAMNVFTNFSLLPLQVISFLGIVSALGGFCLGLWYLILWSLSSIVVPGYASLIVTILTMGGMQLLSLGIIGEYLGRMHLNVNRMPQYTIRNKINHRDDVSEP